MTKVTTPELLPVRLASAELLRTGEATPAEVAKLSNQSRQLISFWAASDGIDWKSARATRLARIWRHLKP